MPQETPQVPQTDAPLQGQDPQAILEMLAAAGVLGDHPVVDLIAQMHQQRMLAQGVPPRHPDLGMSLMPKPSEPTRKAEGKEKK